MKVKLPEDIKLAIGNTTYMKGDPEALKAFAQEILAMKEEFFEGQLVEARDSYEDNWSGPYIYEGLDESPYQYRTSEGLFKKYIRPYNHPNIIQFRDHKAGDPMPTFGAADLYIRQRVFSSIKISVKKARDVDWFQNFQYAPVDGW